MKRAIMNRPRRYLPALCVLLAAVCLTGCGRMALRRRPASAGLEIVPVFQFLYREPVCTIGGERKSVASSGCGAACLSMVVTYLTGNDEQTPQSLFEQAWKNGDYWGYGLSHEALDRLAKDYGVGGRWIGRDGEAIRQALEEGHPVIAHMGPGLFALEGHYVLLRGITEDGHILLNDPNSWLRTRTAFDLSLILEEAKGQAPFRVCWAEG